jgi:hypothetical protein
LLQLNGVGLAYTFVRDKNIDTIEKAKGKKFAYLHYDQAQKTIVESINLVAVPSDISDFVKKFNSGQVDVIAAPAYAYKPLEISKGLANGALFNFPVDFDGVNSNSNSPPKVFNPLYLISRFC